MPTPIETIGIHSSRKTLCPVYEDHSMMFLHYIKRVENIVNAKQDAQTRVCKRSRTQSARFTSHLLAFQQSIDLFTVKREYATLIFVL